ncbi:MAG: hypothetical protein IIC64_18470 [SAR324 cluster bacterium]|nr:hypothetical protein [SAR324 cluster bacterium]
MKNRPTDPKETIADDVSKAGKAAKTVKTAKTGKAAKTVKAARTGKAAKTVKAARTGKAAKTVKTAKTGKAAKTVKTAGTGNTAKVDPASNFSEETEKRHSDLYESLSGILKDRLQRAGTLTEEVFERALKEAMEYAGEKRAHYKEDIARVSGFVKRDWHAAIGFARDQTRRSLNPDRWQAGIMGVLSSLAKSAGEQLESFANKIDDKLTYKTGEVAGAGNLACTQCGQTLSFETATPIPPCSKCHNNAFRRTF